MTQESKGSASSPLTMSRREAVWRLAVLMGGAMVGSEAFLSGQAVPDKKMPAPFTDADKALLDKIGDTIVPATDIPGAAAVGIGEFMATMVNECYTEKQHATFAEGLVKINEASIANFGAPFVDCTAEQRTKLLNSLNDIRGPHAEWKHKVEPTHYFQMMKELALVGYFSSEIGCTQAVKYIEVPGAYHGDVPYKKGDRAWF